jgi:alanyl-tRNA synthetase
MIMKSAFIRQKFFDFFVKHGHAKVPSSPLLTSDPTLLFTNAGMNQFKDVFLGREQRDYKRAVTIQKCMRAGGKHNDFDEVGKTKRHLIFFEMMGNFSFGDYFKKDAITFAWEFLTKEMGLNKDKLYASVYEQDQEAYDIWRLVIGLPVERVVKLGSKDNFWQMGENGPCGPCSEIYIDRGITFGCGDKTCFPGCHCDRFLEIWNNVFMQFDRQNGVDTPLKRTGVDTGMGLERLCTVVQNVDSVYETDLFTPIIHEIQKITGILYHSLTAEQKIPFHVVAEHARSVSFALADGCLPSNEGRGYVVRKIIRRAALYSSRLQKPFLLADLVPVLCEIMGQHYPELIERSSFIMGIMRDEIERFLGNLETGQEILKKFLLQSTDKKMDGQSAFKLYDTYGFPIELTRLIAEEQGYAVDEEGFAVYMKQQQDQSSKKRSYGTVPVFSADLVTEFVGYEKNKITTVITEIINENLATIKQAQSGTTVWLATQESPFYGESGGQISDKGTVEHNGMTLTVQAVGKFGKVIALQVVLPSDIKVGDQITLEIDESNRRLIAANHTATHLLQAALECIVGSDIKQAGSMVTEQQLRFDFTARNLLSRQELDAVEKLINEQIVKDMLVTITQSTYQEAIKTGVKAFFGDKYDHGNVRVVRVGNFSAELCGGTHAASTGVIGLFKIIEQTTMAAGVRRIVAFTGIKALEYVQQHDQVIKHLELEFKVQNTHLIIAIDKQKQELEEARKELVLFAHNLLYLQLPVWCKSAEIINSIAVGSIVIPTWQKIEPAQAVQELVKQAEGLWCVMVPKAGTSFSVAIGVSKNMIDKVSLSQFATYLKAHGFTGGGNNMLLRGSIDNDQLGVLIKKWVQEQK